MVRAATTLAVRLSECLENKTLNNGVNNTHGIIFRYIPRSDLAERQPVIVAVRFCMEFCARLI